MSDEIPRPKAFENFNVRSIIEAGRNGNPLTVLVSKYLYPLILRRFPNLSKDKAATVALAITENPLSKENALYQSLSAVEQRRYDRIPCRLLCALSFPKKYQLSAVVDFELAKSAPNNELDAAPEKELKAFDALIKLALAAQQNNANTTQESENKMTNNTDEKFVLEESDTTEQTETLERYRLWGECLQKLQKTRSKAQALEAYARSVAGRAKKDAAKIEREYQTILFSGPENFVADPTPLLTLAEKYDAEAKEIDGLEKGLVAAKNGASDSTDAGDWRSRPISDLGDSVKSKTLEAASENFQSLGSLGDWLSVGDDRDKRKGLTAKRIDELAAALEPFYADAEAAEFEKADALASEREEKKRADEENAAPKPAETPPGDALTDGERDIVRYAIIQQIESFRADGEIGDNVDIERYEELKAQFNENEESLTRSQFDELKAIFNACVGFEESAA